MQEIAVEQLHEMIEQGQAVYLVDVRQPWEHELVALPGSLLVPLDQLAARAREVQPPPDALVVAYCHHGVRSLHAAALLGRLGHRVASLAGGIDAWARDIDPELPRY